MISPGAVAVESHDLARAERTSQRQLEAHQAEVDLIASYYNEHGEFPPERSGRQKITEWSRRSRSRMVRCLCELDYSPLLSRGMLAIVTLTYPGDWLPVAGDGQAVKKHVRAFLERYAREWGARLVGVWKLEFQARGAPHIHILCAPPLELSAGGQPFRQWLSSAWAEVVGHPDPDEYRKHLLAGTAVDYAEGLKLTDPKRVSVYFTKHGLMAGKEYQNKVPAEWQEPGKGPGRFWGYWGLQRCTAAVPVAPGTADTAKRVMRRWAHAQRILRDVQAPRARLGLRSAYPEVVGLSGALLMAKYNTTRKVRRRVRRLKHGHNGWVSVNDGPAFASEIARFLEGSGSGGMQQSGLRESRRRPGRVPVYLPGMPAPLDG